MKMRDMVVMKDVVANLLLRLATSMGAVKSEDRRLKLEDGRSACGGSTTGDGAIGIRDARSQQVDALLTAHPVWGVEEAKATMAFLNSRAGQLFSKRIRLVAAHVAIEGANDRANTIHSAGVSAGWNECVRYIHSLSRVSGNQEGQVGPSPSQHETNLAEDEDEETMIQRHLPFFGNVCSPTAEESWSS
jgi:hypothetical protein